MYKFFLILACLVPASSAFAGSTTCPTGPYTLYLVANFSCVTNGLLYLNFGNGEGTANPTGLAIPASAITVTPITTDGNGGFQFSSGWNVNNITMMGTNFFQDNLITFAVVGSIADLHLTFNGSFTGTGIAGVAETYCINQTSGITGCPQVNSGTLNVSNPPGVFNADCPPSSNPGCANFVQPVTSISISKDINVSTNTNGTASISQVINTFSTSSVPEPLSFVLIGSGLLGIGLLRARLRRR